MFSDFSGKLLKNIRALILALEKITETFLMWFLKIEFQIIFYESICVFSKFIGFVDLASNKVDGLLTTKETKLLI